MLNIENGAYYSGEQSTNSGSFKIDMKINFFDLDQAFLSGTFKIHDLTPYHSILNTYFEGKLIGTHNSFTENDNDPDQWVKFTKWSRSFINSKQNYDINKSKYLYIKIKEQFLLPDPKVTSVQGASIEGCYYCCYYKSLDCFAGFYACGDKHIHTAQQIVLVRTSERTSQAYEFA
ncbi:GID complex subunit 4 [Conglomerata obtusa]